MMDNTKNMLSRNNTWSVKAILLVALLAYGPSAVMPLVWINLRDVYVQSTPIDQPINMFVDRTVRFKFSGSFKVIIRDENELFVCSSPDIDPFAYNRSIEDNIEPSLSWWLGGKAAMRACREDGFGLGKFLIDTCHKVHGPFELVLAKRCVRSNWFYIIDPEEYEKNDYYN